MKMLTFYTLADAEDYIFNYYQWDSLNDLDRLYNEYIFIDHDGDAYKEYIVPASIS